MPKRTNSAHGGPTKRKDITLDEAKNEELRSPRSLDLSHSNTESPRKSAAILAGSNGALQRLADIAQYFESSFANEIDVVEEAYRTEMERENEIKRLGETVQTLTYFKSEEMDNLRCENKELKAGQEACGRERELCQTMEGELKARHAEAEAGREEDYKRKLQDEKAKFQKSMRAKKAEIEAGSKEKVEELKKQNEDLSAMNEELKQCLSEAKKKLETKKARHARVEKSLEEDNESLTAELKQMKSEFPVGGKPVEHYTEKFQRISDAIREVSSKYFQKLPERAMEKPEAVHQELSKLNPIFGSTPIWQTEISEFLRLRDVQHVISVCLCDFIWRPFFPRDSLPSKDLVGSFLEEVSKSLSRLGGRSESAWRVLTLRGIDDLNLESSRADGTLQQVLEILRPLTSPSELVGFERDLAKIIKESITLWKTARKDKAKFIIEKRPDPGDKEKWQAEDDRGFVETSMLPDEKIDTTGIPSLCLFPSILQTTSEGATVVVHQGSALFPNIPHLDSSNVGEEGARGGVGQSSIGRPLEGHRSKDFMSNRPEQSYEGKILHDPDLTYLDVFSVP